MNLQLLSRTISHVLRHEPWLYELELDDDGWVPVEDLLLALRKEKLEWRSLNEADLGVMITRSDKQRHELKGGRIRALYGHSTPGKFLKESGTPPDRLYHGTSPETARTIQLDGLRPMRRQYVHLSRDVATATEVGKRKSHTPVIMMIRARQAYEQGMRFYRANDRVWLADEVPAKYIDV